MASGMSHGMWSSKESEKKPSAWRELMVVSCIKSLGHVLCCQRVKCSRGEGWVGSGGNFLYMA